MVVVVFVVCVVFDVCGEVILIVLIVLFGMVWFSGKYVYWL